MIISNPIGDYLVDLFPKLIRELCDFEFLRELIVYNHAYKPHYTQKQDYKLHSLPGKTFSGYHILAWYYVSFKLAIPDQLEATGLPFEKEFSIASSMFGDGKPS